MRSFKSVFLIVFLNAMPLVLLVFALTFLATGCGREPSRLLRQGQLPVNDFPLFMSDGTGTIYKFQTDGSKTEFATGLDNPQGIATDRYGHLFVVEQNAGRVWKYNADSGSRALMADGLALPSVIAVDSVGEVFVTQDTPHNIIRLSDRKVVASHFSKPTGLVIGVNDLFVVADFTPNKVFWGLTPTSPSATVQEPVNTAIDGMGRVYVAEGVAAAGRVFRYHQDNPGSGEIVATNLKSANGIAVDAVGNIYVTEKGLGAVTLITIRNTVNTWASGFADPAFLAFTQY